MNGILNANSLVDSNIPINSAALFSQTQCLATKNTELAAAVGNGIVLYAMFVLQQILAQQALNPVADLANIVSLANAIAALNNSLSVTNVQ